jgi:hypothetical protein
MLLAMDSLPLVRGIFPHGSFQMFPGLASSYFLPKIKHSVFSTVILWAKIHKPDKASFERKS